MLFRSPILFNHLIPASTLWMSIYALALVGLMIWIGFTLDRNLVAPVEKLARLTEEMRRA